MHDFVRRTIQTRPLLQLAASPAIGVLRVLEAGAGAAEVHGAEVHVYPLTAEVTSIGRGARNSVLLLDPSVSREHAYLFATPEGWQIENTAARNPLWVEGRAVAPGERCPLLPGQTLRLGNTLLQLLAPVAPPLVASAPEGAEQSGTHVLSPGVTLQFALRGSLSPGLRWALWLGALGIFVLSAIITLGTVALAGQNALATGGPGRVLAAVTIPLIPLVGVALVVLALDRYEREPLVTLLGALLWGAIIAIPPILLFETPLGLALRAWLVGLGLPDGLAGAAGPALSAGLLEEAIKGLGLLALLLVLHDEFDNLTDGVLYGLMIGAGFALVENFAYFAGAGHGQLGFLVLGRIVLGWLSHSTFTALLGAGLGYAREVRDRRRQVLLPLAGFGAGLALHVLFDLVAFGADVLFGGRILGALPVLLTLAAEYLPLFAVQYLVLHLVLAALDREAATVREYLAPEVLASVVTPDEYLLLQDARLRAGAERAYALAYGLRPYLTARALHQTAIGLAFRRWHVAMGDAPKRGPRQPEEVYRARIARLRRSLVRQVRSPQYAPLAGGRGLAAEPTRPLPQDGRLPDV